LNGAGRFHFAAPNINTRLRFASFRDFPRNLVGQYRRAADPPIRLDAARPYAIPESKKNAIVA
jgi:hypothetical protein